MNMLAIILIIAMLPIQSFAETQKVDYLALGDSLAAGINEQNTLTDGYADYLADELERIGVLQSFNKGFAYPGFKTTNILNDLEANSSKPIVAEVKNGVPVAQELITISEAIKAAELITLSVGANDVLANLTKNADGTFTFDTQKVLASVEETAKNVGAIIEAIKKLNPNAKVVVMGYYNPFPTITSMKFQLDFLVNTLDTTIEKVVKGLGATFIDVKADIATNAATYLPNVNNIHLSEVGYKAVAAAMFEALNDEYITTPEQPTFTLPKDVASTHWGVAYIEKALKSGIFKGNADGTFKPNQSLTRIQMTSIIARQFNLPTGQTSLPFNDLTSIGTETKAELQAVYSLGIVQGDEKGNFNPNKTISREQFALILLRAYEKLTNTPYTPKSETTFKDIQMLKAESQRAIQLLAELGLVDAVEKFNPRGNVTRAQAAKILVSYQANAQ